MKVILFGATGMVGQGVLRECLLDAGVERVLVVGRSPTGQHDAKLLEVLHKDFTNFSAIESELGGYDACFFCLGVSSVGMDPERYRHLTHDITLSAANTLVALNPRMVFTYVTGRSTDSTEQGPVRWARVKGKTENDLLKLPFKAAYMFRPAGIQPLHGVRSKVSWIQAIYVVTAPLLSSRPQCAEVHDHQRTARPRHDQGGTRWLSEAGAGERGYQLSLIVIPRCAIAHLRARAARARNP